MKNNNWINPTKQLPQQTDEYNVVWQLSDGRDPVATTMAFDAITKRWTDLDSKADCTDSVLLWQPLPEVPKLLHPFEVIDALGGSLTGDYQEDLKRLLESNRVCSAILYDEAYQMDQQP